MTVNGLSPHSPTPAAFAAARISAEKLLVPFARAAEAIRRCCPATSDLRTSTKNSFETTQPIARRQENFCCLIGTEITSASCPVAALPPIPLLLPLPAQYRADQTKLPRLAGARRRQTFPQAMPGFGSQWLDSTDSFPKKLSLAWLTR